MRPQKEEDNWKWAWIAFFAIVVLWASGVCSQNADTNEFDQPSPVEPGQNYSPWS